MVGESFETDDEHWYIFDNGEAESSQGTIQVGDEFGWCPHAENSIDTIHCKRDSKFVKFDKASFESLRLEVPNLNYGLRKYRMSKIGDDVEWLLGEVPIR